MSSWTQISCSRESIESAPCGTFKSQIEKSHLKDGLRAKVTQVQHQFLDKLLKFEAEADNNQEGDKQQDGEGGEADVDGHLHQQGVLRVEGGGALGVLLRLGHRPGRDRLYPALAEPVEADFQVKTAATLAKL